MPRPLARRAAAAALLLVLTACAHAGTNSPLPNTAAIRAAARTSPSGKIDHIVIIIQENRSFDNLFQGYPGADTQSYGYANNGKKITLKPITIATKWDIAHDLTSYLQSCDGTGSLPGTDCRMDGFNIEAVTCGFGIEPCPNLHPMYGYVPHSEIKPYFTLAQRYVLADRMFASNIDESSFVSHQYAIAAQANATVNFPSTAIWGCDGGKNDVVRTLTQQRTVGKAIRACFSDQTLGDEMDAAGVSWHYYTSGIYKDGNLWNAYQAIKHIRYGPDWKADVITPQTKFFDDVKHGTLPQVSWVTPVCATSDHASCGQRQGPYWVASLVNAIGESPYWKSSAIFIFWDDPGGWYDHVAPPLVDYDGLGLRVPLLMVSPYVKKGYITNVQYEHGSLLRFIEDRFGLPRLAASDTRANSPADDPAFDFTQAPRPFVKIPSKMNAQDFERAPLDLRPVDTE